MKVRISFLLNYRLPSLIYRIQLKICKALADFTGHQSIIHVNNLIKAFIKFILIIDGPSVRFLLDVLIVPKIITFFRRPI